MNAKENQRRVWNLVGDIIVANSGLIAMIAGMNLVAALFEGGTLGGLYLIAQMIFAGASFDFTALGFIGEYIASIQDNMGRTWTFFALVGAITLSQILRSLLQFGGVVCTTYLRTRIQFDFHNRIFKQITEISFAKVSRYHVGDLWNYIKLGKSIETIIRTVNMILAQTLIVLTYLAILMWISWWMTLIGVVALFLLSLSVNYFINRVGRISKELLDMGVGLSKRTAEFLSAIRVLKYFAREDHAVQLVRQDMEDAVKMARQGSIWQASIKPTLDAISVFGMAFFLIVTFYLLGGEFKGEIPDLLFFFYILYRLVPLVGPLNSLRTSLVSNWPAANRLVEFLRQDNKEYLIDGNRPINHIQQEIEFKNVSLRYLEDERRAVNDVSFKIPAGSMVALVGESGSGKSSVTDLLLRLYDPTSGEIRVDGVGLQDLRVNEWRERIGIVSQDVFLFHASIRDNIAFGKLGADDDDIFRAARAAHAYDFILELENGFDTIIGDRGFRLSGGQRQRIALARSLIRDPDVLVLDEATSDLDSESEQLILDAMEEFRGKRTILAVAHRLSTIRSADSIVVFESGRVMETGSHDELIAAKGIYAKLWNIQTR